jgi:Tol biopolymer transport system component
LLVSAPLAARAQSPDLPGLYVTRFDGAALARLGSPSATIVWAPDSRTAVIIEPAGDLTIVDTLTGTSTSLPSLAGRPVADALWSPTGRLLALRMGSPFQFGVLDTESGALTPIAGDPAFGMSWLPNERGLTVVQVTGQAPAAWQIVTVDPATGAVVATVLAASTTLAPGAIAWSPDGRVLALSAGGGPQNPQGDPATAGVWIVSDGAPAKLASGAVFGGPSWTPDGQIFAQLGGQAMLLRTDGGATVLASDIQGSTFDSPAQLQFGTLIYSETTCDTAAVYQASPRPTPRQISEVGAYTVSPQLSPSGATVAWVVNGAGSASLQLYSPLADQAETQLMATGLHALGWSPNGAALALLVLDAPLRPFFCS